jgi:two-component system, NtrC family, sensor histidine kinase PilS
MTAESLNNAARRSELYLLSLFRVFQATVLLMLLLLGASVLPAAPSISMRIVAVLYLVGAVVLMQLSQRRSGSITAEVMIGAGLDLIVAAIALRNFGGAASGAGALMLITIALTSSTLSARLSAFVAAIAALIAVGEALLTAYTEPSQSRNLVQTGLFGLSFFIVSGLIFWLGRRFRESQALADKRGEELLGLAEVNELIIQRMRTGVLVVDLVGEVKRYNESAWYLLGMPSPQKRHLSHFAGPLLLRLREWLIANKHDPTPVMVTTGVPPIVPRMTRIGGDDAALVLVFLEDETQVSRRAEEMTLSSLGRLSASIAHEVRNPLGAISNAAQLLQEAELSVLDRQMVDIINSQCRRMNGIVENVLQLSRRERSRPEDIVLNEWVKQFAEDFRQSLPKGLDPLRIKVDSTPIHALIDPSQLTQACWNLVRNSLAYGQRPDHSPEVWIRIRKPDDSIGAIIEVIDRGPGVPQKVRESLFQPFFTTRDDGTGLGLYICKELLEANQASIEYIAVATGGSCFRIRLTAPTPDIRRNAG